MKKICTFTRNVYLLNLISILNDDKNLKLRIIKKSTPYHNITKITSELQNLGCKRCNSSKYKLFLNDKMNFIMIYISGRGTSEQKIANFQKTFLNAFFEFQECFRTILGQGV